MTASPHACFSRLLSSSRYSGGSLRAMLSPPALPSHRDALALVACTQCHCSRSASRCSGLANPAAPHRCVCAQPTPGKKQAGGRRSVFLARACSCSKCGSRGKRSSIHTYHTESVVRKYRLATVKPLRRLYGCTVNMNLGLRQLACWGDRDTYSVRYYVLRVGGICCVGLLREAESEMCGRAMLGGVRVDGVRMCARPAMLHGQPRSCQRVM